MEAIAEAAGVTKPVLYQHFPSKHALYADLLTIELGRLEAAFEQAIELAEDNAERLRRGFGAYVDFVDVHEDAFRVLFTESLGRENAFRDRIAGRIAAIIVAEAGLAETRARALAAAMVGMAEGAATWWLASSRPLPAPELADELAGLAWKGFARFRPPGSESDQDQ